MLSMQTVFDRPVDQRLIADALAPAAFGSMWLDPHIVGPAPDYPRAPAALSCGLVDSDLMYENKYIIIYCSMMREVD